MEELLKAILDELKNISELQSQGPDGDVLFGKFDSIISEIRHINTTVGNINNRIESLEIDITKIADNTEN